MLSHILKNFDKEMEMSEEVSGSFIIPEQLGVSFKMPQ